MARRAQPQVTETALELPNDPSAIRALEAALLAAVQQHKYPEAASFAIRLALEEALYNAFRHGHKNLPDEPISVVWSVDARTVCITIEDRGPGFNPDRVPDPTSPDRIELPGGRGVMLMRAYMTRVEFNGRGNRVRMIYERPDDRSN